MSGDEDIDTVYAGEEEEDGPTENNSALVSRAQVQEHLERLLAVFRRRDQDLPVQLSTFAPAVQALQELAFDTVFRVGFLGASNMGKSFLLNALLRCTAHDALEYAQTAFRESHGHSPSGKSNRRPAPGSELDYVARFQRLGRPLPAGLPIQHVRLAALPDLPSLAKELDMKAASNTANFDKKLMEAFHDRDESPEGKNFKSDTAWLLPSNTTAAPTTAVTIRMHFGRTWHMVLRYHTRLQMQEIAFAWLETQRSEDKGPHVQLREQWRHFVGTDPAQARVAFSGVTHASDLPLCAAAMAFADRCEVYEGLGHTRIDGLSSQRLFDVDRQWIRAELAAVMSNKLRSFALDSLDVFVPSRLLEDGCELLDIPGSGDSHLTEMVREEVQDCHQLFLLTQQSLDHNQSLSDAIRQSGFMENMLQNDPDKIRDLHVVGYFERLQGSYVLSKDADASVSHAAKLTELEAGTNDWLTDHYPSHASELKKRMSVYLAEPVTFLTLLLEQPSATIQPEDLQRMQQQSNILRIINTICSIPRRRAQMALAALIAQFGGEEDDGSDGDAGAAASGSVPAAASAAAASSGASASSSASASAASSGSISSRVVGLLPRVLKLLETELRGLETDVQDARVSKLAGVALGIAKNRKLLQDHISNAARNMKVDLVRKAWQDRFDEAAKSVLASAEVGLADAMKSACQAGVALFQQDGRIRLTDKNISVSLGPVHGGNRPPLHLRELLYRHLAQHPLNTAAIVKGLREQMEDHLQEHTKQLQQQVLDELLSEVLKSVSDVNGSVRKHGSIQRAVQRAVEAAQAQVSASLSNLFSGALTVEDMYSLCDKAFRANLKAWLATHNDAFWGASNLEALRDTVAHAIPTLYTDFHEAFRKVLNKEAEKKLKKAFWDIWYVSATKSAIRLIAARLMQELAALKEAEGASPEQHAQLQSTRTADLNAIVSYLQEWRAQATKVLAQRDSSNEEIEVLHSFILRSFKFSQLSQQLGAQQEELHLTIAKQYKTVRKQIVKALQKSDQFFVHFNANKKQLTEAQTRTRDDFRRVLLALQKSAPSMARQQQQLQALNTPTGLASSSIAIYHAKSVFARNVLGWSLRLADVPSDGDCLFTALAHQLRWAGGQKHDAALPSLDDLALNPATLRSLAVQRMRKLFANDAEFAAKYGSTLNTYCERMLRSGCWGGEPEIVALSEELQMQILVWQQNGGLPLLFTPPTLKAMPVNLRPTLQIAAVNVEFTLGGPINHFVSMIQSDFMTQHPLQQQQQQQPKQLHSKQAPQSPPPQLQPRPPQYVSPDGRCRCSASDGEAWLRRREQQGWKNPRQDLLSLLRYLDQRARRVRDHVVAFECGHTIRMPMEVFTQQLRRDVAYCPVCVARSENIQDEQWRSQK